MLWVESPPRNALLIGWPAASTGFARVQNPDLTAANWTTVTKNPEIIGSEFQLILSPGAPHSFYRLHTP